MASSPLSSAEIAFVRQSFKQRSTLLPHELGDFIQQMNAVNSGALSSSSQDPIVGRLKGMVNFTQDIETMSAPSIEQTLDFLRE